MNKKRTFNRRIAAAQLRRRATRIDRSAWVIEQNKLEPMRHSRDFVVSELRADAQALRRLADQFTPKAKSFRPKGK